MYTPAIPALGRWKQEDQDFKVILNRKMISEASQGYKLNKEMINQPKRWQNLYALKPALG